MFTFTIGKLSKKTNLKIDTIRYYEKIGLIPEPEKSPTGYRLFTDIDTKRLKFIKNAQSLGFTLAEISTMLSLKTDKAQECSQVANLIDNKIEVLDTKIRSLNEIRSTLNSLKKGCGDSKDQDECPFLSILEESKEGSK